MMTITIASEADLEKLIVLGKMLWPDETDSSLTSTFKETFYRQNEVTFKTANEYGHIIGFAIFSIRNDYVEGTMQSPTGYLEAIVLDKDHRGSGHAQQLLQHGMAWCKERGCQQLGSDVEIANVISQHFHEKMGFQEANRVVNYIMNLEG